MVSGVTLPDEVGPKYDCGLVSPTWGQLGLNLKPGSYHRDQQLIKRQEVVAALSQAIADRDIEFWTRESQFDWTKGQNQQLFSDPSRYADASGIDVSTLGALKLVPLPSVVATAPGPISGRGAALAFGGTAAANAVLYFPWTDGNYTYSLDRGATWQTSTTPAGGKISDIMPGIGAVLFSFYNVGGLWTTGLPPAALTQWDTGLNRYSKLIYDPLRKRFYGITAADQNVQLHQLNAGGAPTIIFDFGFGRLDGLALYQGNIVMSWNISAYLRGTGPSRIYQYDGTNVTRLADMPDDTFVTGLHPALGYLFITAMESTPFFTSGDHAGLYYMIGTSAPVRIDDLDATYLDDIPGACFLGYPHFMAALGTSLFVCTQQRLMRYDLNPLIGGLSRSFGDNAIGGIAGWLQGILSVAGIVYGIVGQIGVGPGGVVKLSGSTFGLVAVGGAAGQRLTSSRFDLGLPYVDKYWYAFEITCDGLLAGQSIAMEYSLDDGVTWTACGNSPFSGLGARRFNFLVQQVNPHIRYRVTPIAAASTASPVVHSISARFAPSNPSLKVWQLTVLAQDQVRMRNNQVSDVSGQDILTYLFNVSKQNETVTFYDNDEPLVAGGRTPHTVWVMQADQDSFNTGGTYNPLRREGELALLLWEV